MNLFAHALTLLSWIVPGKRLINSKRFYKRMVAKHGKRDAGPLIVVAWHNTPYRKVIALRNAIVHDGKEARRLSNKRL